VDNVTLISLGCVMRSSPKVLIVEEQALHAKGFSSLLKKKGFEVCIACQLPEIRQKIEEHHIAIALVSMARSDNQAAALIRKILKMAPECVCIALTSGSKAKEAIQALDAGAVDYFTRPIRDWERFLSVCTQALSVWNRTFAREEQRFHMQNLQKHRSIKNFHPIKGNSPTMHAVMDIIDLVAPLRVATLICGESGVGKELVARAVHQESPFSEEPFVAINCVAIQPDLFESELFGHERGSFTGAYTKKSGLCAEAGQGTLFLDEIGDLPLRLQPKLLRLLEQRTFRAVGSTKVQDFQARVICATHVNLEQAVQEGRFRKDLYYRISAQEIYVPPLRDRKEDIQLLAYTFVEKYNKLCGRDVQSIDPDALKELESYDWSRNNVRELEREIQRAVVRARQEQILTKAMISLPKDLSTATKTAEKEWLELEYHQAQKYQKRVFLEQYIQYKLECAAGNKSKAARLAGLASSNFHRLLRQLESLQEEEAQNPDP